MFGLLTVLWCWTMADYFNRKKMLKLIFVIVVILIIGYGITIEFVQQGYVSNRSFDNGDIVADIIGATNARAVRGAGAQVRHADLERAGPLGGPQDRKGDPARAF